METHRDATPVIIEVAINGGRRKADNPHVPLEPDEIVASVDACVRAGASLVHLHAGEPVVGSDGSHASLPYVALLRRIRDRHPALRCYPTLPGGGHGTTMVRRLAHVIALREAGLLDIAPVDPGTMNYGGIGPAGEAPRGQRVYQTTFEDVHEAFALLAEHRMGCTMSLFEPGFLQLVLAHRAAGSLPPASIVKFEFTSNRRLMFGLPPSLESLAAWRSPLRGTGLPWMVTMRDGDVSRALARWAIEQGGHVRVGLEDFAGSRQPSNDALVAEVAAIARECGRPPATPEQCARIIGLGR